MEPDHDSLWSYHYISSPEIISIKPRRMVAVPWSLSFRRDRRREIISFAAKRLSVTRMPAPSKSSSTRCRESVGDNEVAT